MVAGPLTAGASAGEARDPGLLAYEQITGRIFTIEADGTGNREILTGAHQPAWSPDGTRLLYERSNGMGGLWSARADGTGARRIVGRAGGPCDHRGGASDGAWSPSGRRVAFVARSSGRDERPVREICTVAVDGSGLRRLGAGSEPDWFPGGRRIAFIAAARSPGSFSSRIATMRRNGGGVRVLLGNARGYRDSLDVSPDGRRLAFVETAARPGYQPPQLRVMNLRSGRIRTIPASTTGPIGAATWSPGGTRIAFLVNLPPVGSHVASSSAYTIRPDGTGMTRLFALPHEEQRGVWGTALSWRRPQ